MIAKPDIRHVLYHDIIDAERVLALWNQCVYHGWFKADDAHAAHNFRCAAEHCVRLRNGNSVAVFVWCIQQAKGSKPWPTISECEEQALLQKPARVPVIQQADGTAFERHLRQRMKEIRAAGTLKERAEMVIRSRQNSSLYLPPEWEQEIEKGVYVSAMFVEAIVRLDDSLTGVDALAQTVAAPAPSTAAPGPGLAPRPVGENRYGL